MCDNSESVVISTSGVEKNSKGKWRQVDITRNIDRMENRVLIDNRPPDLNVRTPHFVVS